MAVRAPARPDHVVENAEVARLLREMADVLEIEAANPYRVRAYRNAGRVIEQLGEPVAALLDRGGEAALDALPGIGEDLAAKVAEIVRTGSFRALGQEERKAPRGAAALMRVPGIGPRRARALAESLRVRSVAELHRAVRAGKLRTLPGFGEVLEQKILAELGAREGAERRMLRATAAQYAESYVAWMRGVPDAGAIEVAGSYRRCRETVGDLDILVAARRGSEVAERFVSFPEVSRVLAHGPTRCSVRLRSGLQVDLRVLAPESFGAALHYFTGSKAHNIAVRRLAQERGLKLSEYGVFRGKRRIGGSTEREVFDAVGLPFIPPELREDRGELEAARQGTLPALVTTDDIRGDLQSHTTWSDGRDSLEAMADAAEAMGYAYLAVTDHTRSVAVTGGMERAGFLRQRRRIDALNARRARLTILAGAEVDIHADGTLDLDDVTLAGLDIVLVSLHSKLDLGPEAQTRRIVRALQHPHVDVFAHPTGRLLERRRGAAFDFDLVCRVAADHGVMLEINGQPERLDLDDTMARSAVERGVRLTLGTDAHATAELRFMRWGVDQARRAWVEPRHLANTCSLAALRRLLHGGRR